MLKIVKAFAPASIGNLSVGFDILGLSIDCIGDEVKVTLSNKPGVRLNKIYGNSNSLSLDPEKNCVTVPIIEYLSYLNLLDKIGIEVELYKNLPLKSGMGSSASSSVAGVFATNYLLGNKLSRIDLLNFILKGEELASGAKHADNVAPSLLGGITLVRNNEPIDIIKINYPENLVCVLAHPDLYVDTYTARKILPEKIYLKDFVKQSANLSGFIIGMMTNDFNLISRSFSDIIVEPVRKNLLPFFDDLKKAILETDALGMGISGSGPSVFALAQSQKDAEKIKSSMIKVFERFNLKNEIYISKISKEGAKIITEE